MAQVANERVVNGIKTRILHNKDYVEVNERVRILHELRKAGEIKEFEMVESEPHEIAGQLYWRVSARIDGKLYIANAEVKLDAPKNTPDGTNPVSCAETSAFGRMLAFAGLGTVESIASYEEIARSQPFVAVIEQKAERVVEAGHSPRQLVAVPKVEQHTLEEVRVFFDRFFKPERWTGFKQMVLGLPVEDAGLADEELYRLWAKLTSIDEDTKRRAQAATSGKGE